MKLKEEGASDNESSTQLNPACCYAATSCDNDECLRALSGYSALAGSRSQCTCCLIMRL